MRSMALQYNIFAKEPVDSAITVSHMPGSWSTRARDRARKVKSGNMSLLIDIWVAPYLTLRIDPQRPLRSNNQSEGDDER